MSLAIRVATAADAPALATLNRDVQALHAAAHPQWFSPLDEPAVMEAWFAEALEKPDQAALIAEREGRAIGYLLHELITREPGPIHAAYRYAMIHHVAVAEQARRQGVALALIDALRARLREAQVTELRVVHFTFNDASARLMQRAGLEPIHVTVSGPV
ncbi:GNAT family N-acetyltransferase [Pontivivens ytuae]|uniref:GNAT family N-acetyltransferase n=1 Tax=Pontivivens ytuae TaxID=2789856 RepID=A0A7S9QCC1_9RHOB|nr:GNAT family N-acetyltransferase [Pontivivens ytuae]QPH54048.1 GNAT family N-acetyltransferase [Pontivivens ytuae]